MMADPTVQRILGFGCSPAHTQATQKSDSTLHTSLSGHTCQPPSPVDTLSSSISNMAELRADPQSISFQTQASKTSPSSKHKSDSASCHDEGTGSKPRAAQTTDAKRQMLPHVVAMMLTPWSAAEQSKFPRIPSGEMCEPVQHWATTKQERLGRLSAPCK